MVLPLVLLLLPPAAWGTEMVGTGNSPIASEAAIVTLGEHDSGKTVTLRVNSLLRIELTGTPSAGFSWRFTSLDRRYLYILEQSSREINPEMPDGGPILKTWTLRAKRRGATILEMAYGRARETARTAARVLRILVRIEQ
jgi:predicted secreted protein